MGTATLKSILERIVDQIMNVNNTENNPAQRNGDKNAACKKTKTSAKLLISGPLPIKALFLKQNCVKVSRMSEKIRNNSIFRVNLFLVI